MRNRTPNAVAKGLSLTAALLLAAGVTFTVGGAAQADTDTGGGTTVSKPVAGKDPILPTAPVATPTASPAQPPAKHTDPAATPAPAPVKTVAPVKQESKPVQTVAPAPVVDPPAPTEVQTAQPANPAPAPVQSDDTATDGTTLVPIPRITETPWPTYSQTATPTQTMSATPQNSTASDSTANLANVSNTSNGPSLTTWLLIVLAVAIIAGGMVAVYALNRNRSARH